MNCRNVKKFLYAFADGQLSVRANCEVLDHLKMCPACSRAVDEHQALRAAVARSITQVPLPRHLHAKVLNSLHSNTADKPAFAPILRFRFSPRATIGFVAAAASVALLFTIRARDFSPQPSPAPEPVAPLPVVVERGQIAASLVAEIHQSHAAAGRAHQNRDLPNTLDRVGTAIARHFGDRLTVDLPDLSDYGYEFESANFCGVREAGNADGGHVIYASANGDAKLSFFVVPRFDRLDMCGAQSGNTLGAYREYEVEQVSGPPLAVLAWHRDETTFVCCGAVKLHRLKLMVGAIRTAMPDFDRTLKLACAELSRMQAFDPSTHTH